MLIPGARVECAEVLLERRLLRRLHAWRRHAHAHARVAAHLLAAERREGMLPLLLLRRLRRRGPMPVPTPMLC